MKNEIRSERADLFDPNMCIVITFDIIGATEPRSLVDAANRTFTRFESTMSRIVLRDDSRAFYEKMPFSGCTAQVTRSDLDELVTENEKKHFAIENGELMRVFIKPAEGKISVLIMAHHLAGDGKSVIYFIERMMKEATGECGEYQPLVLLNEETLPEGAGISRLYRLLGQLYNRGWAKSGKGFRWEDREKLHSTYWRDRTSVMLKRRIAPECVEKIHTKSKAAHVSINSLILAALMKENSRYKSVGLAVDARIDGNRSMSNQATGITARHIYNEKLTFEQNAQRLHRRIYAKLDKPSRRYFILQFIPLFTPSLIDSILMYTNGLFENKTSKKIAAMIGYAPLKSTLLSVTNLTRLDIASQYGKLHIENLYFIPPVVSYAYQTFGVATTSSGMTVTLHSMNDRYTGAEQRMFNAAIDFLESWSK